MKNRRFQDIRNARYGWRGVRVGEASHPGPQNTVVRGEGFAAATQVDETGVSSFRRLRRVRRLSRGRSPVERVDDSAVSRVEDAQAPSESGISSGADGFGGRSRRRLVLASGAEDPHSRNVVPRLDEMEPEVTVIEALEFDLTIQDSEDEQEPPAMEVQASDTESVVTVRADDPAEEDDRDSLAESSGDGEVESEVEEEIPFRHPGVRTSQRAFNSLDQVNLCEEFKQRSCLMQSVPKFLKGPFRRALRVALEQILQGARTNDTVRQEQGWKLFLLLPRMLLHRPGRRGLVSRAKLLARFESFVVGEWTSLIKASALSSHRADVARNRRRRTDKDLKHRLSRAQSLVHMGELSSARQALEGAELAPGTEGTLEVLRKRATVPREELPRELVRHVPEVPFVMDDDRFNKNVRSAKRGAAAGPSGMTVEHLHPLLDFPKDLKLFNEVAERVARGQVPESIQAAIKMGRMTALSKDDGGVRGIVVGDVVRRLVARTISQQLMEVVQQATAPFQYAMATKAGCECIAHVLQGATEMNPRATILSVDGMSAYDTMSRKAMLQGLRDVPGGSAALPFVSMFYGSPSQYLWEDNAGVVHTIHQGEGGEQGDAMMPLLYSLGQHSALKLVESGLQDGESLFAFLDDTYVVTSPERVTAVFTSLQRALLVETGIRINPGKTKVWNAAGEKPPGCDVMQRITESFDPTALVWRGSEVSTFQQGMKVLGTPLGHPDFVRAKSGVEKHQSPAVLGQDPFDGRRSGFVVAPRPLRSRSGELYDTSAGSSIVFGVL